MIMISGYPRPLENAPKDHSFVATLWYSPAPTVAAAVFAFVTAVIFKSTAFVVDENNVLH